MRSFFKKCLLTLIFLLAILVAITVFFSFFINHTKNNGHYFSSIASDILNKPVKIRSGEVHIFSAYPNIIIRDATVFSENKKNSLFQLNTAKITIDLLKSWQEKSWVIKKIILSDLKINIGGNNSSNNNANKALIQWIKSQESISLNNVQINNCDNNALCKPVFLFSAQLTKQGADQKITMTSGSDTKKITLTSNVHLEEDNKNWTATLNTIAIQGQSASFSGNAIVRFDLSQYLSLSANGNGKINDISLTGIQATYTKNSASFKAKGIATGGSLEKLFPGKLYFSASEHASAIHLIFHNPNIVGTVVLSLKKNTPVKVKLQRLALHFSEKGSFSNTLDPKEIPALSGSVNNFILNGENLGHLSWQSIPVHNGISIQKVKLTSDFDKIVLKGAWVKENILEKIAISGIFTSTNFGNWFQKVHDIARVKNGTLNLKFSLETQGTANTIFALKNLKGKSKFKIQNIIIVDKDKKNASANFFNSLLNLISLQSISSFLTLDFSAIKKSNEFKIFVLKGDLKVENGYLKTKNIAMKSAVANIDFSGNVDFIHDNNNLKMIVYPNIIQSQPLGSCPVLFIFRLIIRLWKKITSYFLDPFFNLQYKITGTLEKPIVKRI
ncbi:MAG: AsmA-like C-terminal region-containing protein [Coxiellaceae bacterium]|nr:AsmA-like C-terminal region-containing protein [Coxiellaceae bacterium]